MMQVRFGNSKDNSAEAVKKAGAEIDAAGQAVNIKELDGFNRLVINDDREVELARQTLHLLYRSTVLRNASSQQFFRDKLDGELLKHFQSTTQPRNFFQDIQSNQALRKAYAQAIVAKRQELFSSPTSTSPITVSPPQDEFVSHSGTQNEVAVPQDEAATGS